MRSYQSRSTVAQLIQYAVHLCLLGSQGVLQSLDAIFCLVQGDLVAIEPLLHQPKLLVNILVPRHQFRECVVQQRAHLLHHLRLVVNKLLVMLQSYLVEMRLLLHPVQLKSLMSFNYQEVYYSLDLPDSHCVLQC